VHFGISRRQERKKLVIKHFLFDSLMNLHSLSFFAHAGIMLDEYYPLGLSKRARCDSYEIIP
jgi:hypothetical protein